MTTRHLITRLKLTLHSDKDFNHLHHTRWQIITTTYFFDFVFKASIHDALLDFVLFVQSFYDLCVAFVLEGNLPPQTTRHF